MNIRYLTSSQVIADRVLNYAMDLYESGKGLVQNLGKNVGSQHPLTSTERQNRRYILENMIQPTVTVQNKMSVAFGSHMCLNIGKTPQKLTLESKTGKTTFIKVPKGEDGFDIAMSTLLDTGVTGLGTSELYTELTDADYRALFSKNPLLIKQAVSGGIMGPLTRAIPGLELKAPFEGEEMRWDLDMSIQDGKVRVALTGDGDATLIVVEQGKVEEAKKLLLKLTEKASLSVKGGAVTGILFIPSRYFV